MMYKKILGSRLQRLIFFVLTLMLVGPLVSMQTAAASTLSNSSVVVGSSLPSAVTTNNISFFLPSLPDIGSVVFEYCSNSSIFEDVCDVPPGIDVTGANLVFQSGNTGFSVDNADTTANKLIITRAIAASAVIQTEYHFTNIVNPNSGGTVFIRISTYGSTNGSGAFIDNGAAAFAINPTFVIGAYVPPFLQACAGLTVASNCSSSTGTVVDLGKLTTSQPGAGTSQLAAATNSPTGLAVFALGTTLTAGNNTIDNLANTSFSAPGTRQFGINLRANNFPQVGDEPTGAGTITPTAEYSSINQFRYNSGEMIAQSGTSTDYKTLTVSYIANISRGTPVGIYSTSLTYMAVAEF